MRKAVLTVHNDRETFTETYIEGERGSFNETHTDLNAWATALIQRYNDTLRPGERARFLDRVELSEVADRQVNREHDWHKTNLVTVEYRGQYFDKMVCTRCKVTGKRYGVDSVTHDAKFKAKKYMYCKPPVL